MNLKMLFVICNSEKKLNKLLNRYKLPFNTVFKGIGTASKSMLDYFGLVPTEKYILMSIIPDYNEEAIINDLKIELKMEDIGKGIGFIIPLSSSSLYVKEAFKKIEGEIEMKNNEKQNHLVIAIVNSGYADKVMNAAKNAGANGGTLVTGHSLGEKNSFKLFNMTIEPEKDIIFIVCNDLDKKNIMESILNKTGIGTDAKGYVISLPIDSTIGLENL